MSLKRMQINKANATIVASIAIAAFITVFSLVASRALWVKRGFQAQLINEKEVAVAQLEENLAAIDGLVVAYQAFVDTPENVIGGNPSGTGDQDGDNAKITLDALPSKYDFPALATSLEKLLGTDYQEISITGQDEEVSQSSTPEELAQAEGVAPEQQIDQQQTAEAGAAVSVVEIPFEIGANGSIASIEELLVTFERSIRPINIKSVSLDGSNSDLTITVSAKTYYQPAKSFTVGKKVIK